MKQRKKPLRILIAEDPTADVGVVVEELEKGEIEFNYRLVDKGKEFRQELEMYDPDIVVSDFSMSQLTGLDALRITRDRSEHLPFLVVTDSINEETAVTCMKAGANDYVLKEQIKRLPFAVWEAIDKSRNRLEKEKMQKRLESSLEESLGIINGMNETVWIISLDGELLEVNETATKTLGYSRDELLDIGLFSIDENLSKDAILKLVQSMPKDQSQFFHTRHTRKDGSTIPVEINSSLIKYQGKTAIMSVARDISERIRREEMLQETEDQLQLLSHSVEQGPASVLITNCKGVIQYVNQTFTKITGYEKDEAIGKTPRLFKSGKQTKEFYKCLWDTILSGNEWHGELINRKKNGELYWEDASISPIFDKNDELTHFVSIREDISEKKKMIHDLVRAKEKAEESDRLKTAFLANISHEIRTPMNGILGFLELLKANGIGAEVRDHYIEMVNKGGERLMRTINDLVEISKLQSDQMEVKINEVDLSDLLMFYFNFFFPQAQEKGLYLQLAQIKEKHEALVFTDRQKVETALSNLIANAIKFTKQGGIQFGANIEEGRVLFFVKDTGVGIPADRMNAVFDRFVQADLNITRPYEGAGLGLTIVKGYIEMLNGEIWVESEVGKGTSFFCYIPYRPVKR